MFSIFHHVFGNIFLRSSLGAGNFYKSFLQIILLAVRNAESDVKDVTFNEQVPQTMHLSASKFSDYFIIVQVARFSWNSLEWERCSFK